MTTFLVFGQQVTDYSKTENWAVHPNLKNEIIKEYIKDSSLISKVDVFFVYPTVFMDKNDPHWNLSVSDEVYRKKIVDNSIRFQASAWGEAGRMFAPFYQQAHIRAYRNLDNGGKEALLLAYNDIRAAFQYYLDNYNQGRPIILAGHSQGTTHLMLLIKEFFDEKPLQNQLIAAYIPGIGIDSTDFCTVPLMTKPDQVGGYLSWNTFKKVPSKKYHDWYKGKPVINPVTWDLSSKADRKKHKGFLFSNNKMYRRSFNTYLMDGGIWISTPHFPYRSLAFAMDDYHIGDVNLFWEDIRLNVKTRISVFFSKR